LLAGQETVDADGTLADVEVDETGTDGLLVEIGDDTVLVVTDANGLDVAGGKFGDEPDFLLAPQTLPLLFGAPRPFFR
jgi:hypothetical protein